MVVVDAGDHTDMGIRCPASDRSTETYSTRCRGVAATDCGATAAAAAAATAELLLARTKGAAAPDDHHARREYNHSQCAQHPEHEGVVWFGVPV